MKKKYIPTLMLCSLTLSMLTALPLQASADEYDSKIQQQDQIVKDLQDQEAILEQKILEFQTEIAAIKTKGQELNDEQIKLADELQQLEAEIEVLSTRMELRKEAMKKQARDLQISGYSLPYVDVILQANSFSDMVTRAYASTRLLGANNDLIRQQEKDEEILIRKKAEMEEKNQQLNQSLFSLQEQLAALEKNELEQNILRNDLAAQRASEESEKNAYIEKKQAAEAQQAKANRLSQAANARREAEAQQVQVEQIDTASQQNQITNQNISEKTTVPEISAGAVHENSGQATPLVEEKSSRNDSEIIGEASSIYEPPTLTAPTDPVDPPDSSDPGNAGDNGNGEQPSEPSNGAGIVNDALKELGKPYVLGGTGPDSYDCSGLVQYVFKKNGIDLPRITYEQEYAGTMIGLDQVQPGDLVFFGDRGKTYHVGIYIGNGQFVHSPKPGDVVKITAFEYYRPSFAVRVI